MPAAARSRLCSRDSAWVAVFAKSTIPLAWSASVIVCAGYLRLLSFASLKLLSFIKSIDVLSTLSRQMIKSYGANVTQCSKFGTISKQSVSSSGDRTFTIVFLYSIIMAATVSFGRASAKSIYSIFPLRMESKALEKSRNYIVASRFFARTPSTDSQNL